MKTPRELRAAAEQADPRLPDREKAAAELARFEEKVQAATWRAIRAWLRIATEAALTGQVLTAGPQDVPPDPAAIAAHAEEWGALVDTHIVGAIEELLGERFAELLDGDHVVSARPWQEQYLAQVKNRMADLPGATFDAVRAEVQLGIDHGDEIPKVRDRIATALSARHGGTENEWLKRSQTIARTETIGAYNGGQLAAAQVRSQATGVQLEKVWLATIDSRTRKDHYRADGQRVPLDAKFQIGSAELDHPGDPRAPAKQVVHCRCTMLEVEPEEETPNTAERQLRDPAEVEQEIAAREADDQIRAFDDPAEEGRLQAARSAALQVRAAAAAAAEKKAAAAARRLGQKLAKQTDDTGVPMRLTHAYLADMDEDALDDLGAHLASRLDDANPIEGQRWDDYETFMDYRAREAEHVDDVLRYAHSDDEVSRAVAAFQQANGRPGLTHPSVGGRAVEKGSTPSRAEVQVEYAQFLEEQYVLAEQFCRGHLLSPAGQRAGADPRSLFSGDARQAIRYASEELLEFWESHARRTGWTEFYYQRTGSPGSAAGAAKQAAINSRIDRDRSALRAAADLSEPEPSEEQVAAYDAGRAAFDAGQPSTDCPHGAEEPDLLRLWIRGFVLARRDALVEELLADDADPVDPAGVVAAATPEGSPMTRRTWRSNPVLAPFAKPTGDGRIFRVGGLTSRDLPLPLLYQESTGMGHDGSTTVGRILEVEFTDEGIVATGDYLDDPALAESVAKAIALVEAGLGGVSVDLDSVVGSLVDANGDPVDMEWLIGEWEEGRNPDVYEQVDEGRLIGVTQVATPAFAEAAIALDPIGTEVSETALEDATGADVAVGAIVTAQVAGDSLGGAREEDPVSITGTVEEVNEDDETVTVGQITADDDGDPVEPDTRVVIPAANVTVVTPAPEGDEEEEVASIQEQIDSITASAGTLFRPPAAWYEDPKLEGPTALTVTDDGRVYGHVAVWGTCHVGYPGQCVEPPSSPSSYSYFHTGAVKLDDGTRIAVGNLTLGGGHADPKWAWRQATKHYDETGYGIATVRAYEDEFGIAVAGALNPGATPEQIAELERSPLSGDWREIGGELDMIGALAVNSGGFPIPRYATGASGDRLSLVAAPGVRPDPGRKRGKGVSLEQLSQRLRREVLQDVRADMQRRARLDRIVAAVGLDPRSRLTAVLESIDN